MTVRELEADKETDFNQSETLDIAGYRRSAFYSPGVTEYH
jgi:hypothetical protein